MLLIWKIVYNLLLTIAKGIFPHVTALNLD
jgi:hypothetical protein